MSLEIWISIILLVSICTFVTYSIYKEKYSETQTTFELKWMDKLSFLVVFIAGLFFIFASLVGINQLWGSFTISDIPKYILVIFGLGFGIYIIMPVIDVLRCNCQSVSVDTINQKLIIRATSSGLVEIPFGEINYIVVTWKSIAKGVSVEFIDICTINCGNYHFALIDSDEFCKLLRKNVKIKRL